MGLKRHGNGSQISRRQDMHICDCTILHISTDLRGQQWSIYYGGFHKWGYPTNGWFMMEKRIDMALFVGYFWGPFISGNDFFRMNSLSCCWVKRSKVCREAVCCFRTSLSFDNVSGSSAMTPIWLLRPMRWESYEETQQSDITWTNFDKCCLVCKKHPQHVYNIIMFAWCTW